MDIECGSYCPCAKDIEARSPDPLRVIAETSDGKWQDWLAHASCFNDNLVDPPACGQIAGIARNTVDVGRSLIIA